MSPLQPLHRDFAFLVAESVPASELLRAVERAHSSLIGAVTLFDIYQGAGIPEGQKSIALSVTFTPATQSLSEAEITDLSAQITALAAKKCGAVLRGHR